jgi:hypothetical protein
VSHEPHAGTWAKLLRDRAPCDALLAVHHPGGGDSGARRGERSRQEGHPWQKGIFGFIPLPHR